MRRRHILCDTAPLPLYRAKAQEVTAYKDLIRNGPSGAPAGTLPAEQQVEAVSKKLVELNPGFDGKVTGSDGRSAPRIENGAVTEIRLIADNDFQGPVLKAIRRHRLRGEPEGQGRLGRRGGQGQGRRGQGGRGR